MYYGLTNALGRHQSGFSPLKLHPALWLDASDASTLWDSTTGGALVAADGSVARWEDKSGNGRHATQGTAVSRPQRKAAIQNGRDVVRFDGSNDYLALSSSYDLPTFSIFAVSKRINNASTNAIYTSGTSDGTNKRDAMLFYAGGSNQLLAQRSDNASYPTASIGNTFNSFEICESNFNGSTLTVSVNGVDSSPVSTSISGSSTDSIWIGAANQTVPGFWMQGDIAEILVFPTALSDTDRGRVEAYLNLKWSIY